MAKHVEGTDLQLEEDDSFQRRDWRAQRIGWVGFALALTAAVLGLFGGGPLSTATLNGDGWSLDYERFARRSREVAFVVRIPAPAGDTVVVEIAGSFFADARIERIAPLPASEIAIHDGQRLTFAASPAEPIEITLRLTPNSAGRPSGRVRVDSGQWLEFSTLVYP